MILTAADRCDRCGAQAYTAWWNPYTKGLLTLCAHHTRPHEDALKADHFELTIDDRDTLLESVREPEPA